MLNAVNLTARLNELAIRARVQGATLGIWSDDEPWVPLSFGQFGDSTPYTCLSGRVTPRVR